MKVQKDIDKYIIYLYDTNEDIKKIVKDTIINLEKYYSISYNNYDIRAYINKYYGIILEIKESIYTTSNNISLKILNDTLFLYEVEDPLKYMKNDIYFYENKFYISPKKLDINLIENSNLIYGRDVYKIIGKGIKI